MESTRTRAYRLWQLWQQMHYPTRLPPPANSGVDLVALDGRAGNGLDRYFARAEPGNDAGWRPALEECLRELGQVLPVLTEDRARYFERLQELIRTVLEDGADDSPAA